MAYQRWWKTIRDQQGNAVNGASVAVYNGGTGTLATVYDPNTDDSAPGGLANPFVTGANGVFGFMAADGEYDVQISGGNGATQQYRVTLNGFVSGSAASLGANLAAATGAGLVGTPTGTVQAKLDLLTTATSTTIPAAFVAADAVVTSAFQAADTTLSGRVDAVEVGQSAAVVGYDTQANLYANLVPVANSVAYVTNDSTPSKNGTYRKVGGTGTGSWVQSSYDRVALVEASSPSYRGAITPGTALSAITVPGTYYGAAGGGFTDLPAGWPTGSSFLLLVLDAFAVAGRFQLQEIREWSAPDNYQFRWMDHNNPTANAWRVPIKDLSVTSAKLADGNVTNIKLGTASVSNVKLADGYTYKADVSTGSMNSILATGRYTTSASLADAPVGSTAGGILDVHTHGIWTTQEFSNILAPDVSWRRMIRTTPLVVYPWGRVKASGAPTITNKTIAFIGDSITENGDYPERIAARLDCTALKFGFGGCRLGTRAHDTADNTNYDAMAMWSIATAINTGVFTGITAAAAALFASNGDDNRTQAAALAAQDWSLVDYMVIFFGTNDWSGDNALGTTGDSTPATFRGAMNYITQQILSVYPNIKIAFVSPMWRSRKNTGDGLDADTNPNTNGVYLIQFADAVVEMAHLNKLPALDLYRESGINKYNASTLLLDGVHPSSGVGYQLVADKVASFLQAQF